MNQGYLKMFPAEIYLLLELNKTHMEKSSNQMNNCHCEKFRSGIF